MFYVIYEKCKYNATQSFLHFFTFDASMRHLPTVFICSSDNN